MAITTAGPFLLARGATPAALRLAALCVTTGPLTARTAPPLRPMGRAPVAPAAIWQDARRTVWRYDFTLPATASAWYRYGERTVPVAADLNGDLRLAFVSCNGQETGDLARNPARRNALWRDLGREHAARPFQLLLHGGDQLYADEVWHCDPGIADWHRRWEESDEDDPGWRDEPFTGAMAEAALDFYLGRYLAVYGQLEIGPLLAQVPSLMIWDDHDIFDGWGSRPMAFQQSPVARGVFAAARTAFCLLQRGAAPDDPPAEAPDRQGRTLSWGARFPGFSVLAPDLRSERTMQRVLGEHGWRALERLFADTARGERVLLLSSVPVIGPRLSLLEGLLEYVPGAQKYEDDLRDQWQSHAHRREWQRLLTLLETQALRERHDITLLSGEIHVATRGVFELAGRPYGRTVHQLVASGIAHAAPPRLYAWVLGALARLGEHPLPGRPTRLLPLPGRRGIYTSQRNYLTLERLGRRWQARWRLERGGWTPPLKL